MTTKVEDTLTWNCGKELDSISVTMEGELSLCHGTVGDKTARGDTVILVIAVHSYNPTRASTAHS